MTSPAAERPARRGVWLANLGCPQGETNAAELARLVGDGGEAADPLNPHPLQVASAGVQATIAEGLGLVDDGCPFFSSPLVHQTTAKVVSAWLLQDPVRKSHPDLPVLAVVVLFAFCCDDITPDEVPESELLDSVEGDTFAAFARVAERLSSVFFPTNEASTSNNGAGDVLGETALSTQVTSPKPRGYDASQAVRLCLGTVDPTLAEHLEQRLSLSYSWCLPWLRTMCARQLPPSDVLLLWDSVFELWDHAGGLAAADAQANPSHVPPVVVTTVVASTLLSKQQIMACDSGEDAVETALRRSAVLFLPEAGPASQGGYAVPSVAELSRRVLDPMRYLGEAAVAVNFSDGPLGIMLGQIPNAGLTVRKFQQDGSGKPMQAEASGKICTGDVLHSVNGVLVDKALTPQLLAALLNRVGRPVCVAFRRPRAPPPPPPRHDRGDGSGSNSPVPGRATPPPPPSSQLAGLATDAAAAATDAAQAVAQAMGYDLSKLAAEEEPTADVPDQGNTLFDPPPPTSSPGEGNAVDQYGRSMATITNASDGFPLPLIAGERYEADLAVEMATWQRARVCDGSQLARAWIKGEVFASTFRIFFHAQHKMPWPDWSIPMHAVLRVETDKQQNTNGNTVRSLTLVCKDGQIRRFSMVQSASNITAGDRFHQFIRKVYQWVYSHEEEFAQQHCEAWRANPPPELPPTAHRFHFDLQAEYERMGLAQCTASLRLVKQTELLLCHTYPVHLLFPANITDAELRAVARYRSKERVPVITWFDPATGVTIARSAQPLVGMNSKRCAEDERLVSSLGELTRARNGARRYCIIDARSKVATQGNRLMGKGVEQMKYYPGAELQYLNIGNIHSVRESADAMHLLFQPQSLNDANGFYGKLEATGWFSHLVHILRGANAVVEAAMRDRCGVLVHCSDGWDRTAQLCALAQMSIDPYYRTLQGLQVLIEKDWLAFGHKFSDRNAQAGSQPSEERSPCFHLWLDCVWQMMRQYPTVFEYNEALLLALLDHVYSCRFGTFLSNSFLDREKHLHTRTLSFWEWVEQRYDDFINPSYEEYVEGPVIASSNPKHIRLWEGYFLRFDVGQLPYTYELHHPPTYYD